MTEKLEPCPFCQSTELTIRNHDIFDSWNVIGQVGCDNCGALGPEKWNPYTDCRKDLVPALEKTKKQAVLSWNAGASNKRPSTNGDTK